MQASPRVDVDEAPYAPGTDLLYVTELEDAHDSIKLLKFDDNLEFFYTETLPMPNSDETSGQRERPVCVTCFLLSRSPVSSRVSLRPAFFGTRIKDARSAMQRESLEMDESQALRGLLSVRKISSVFSSFPDLPNASSVGSLNHATLPICVRRSVVCIPQHEHISRVSFLVCLSVFACTPVHSNSPTTSTDSLACFAGALTKQLSDSFVSQNMCSAPV